MNKNKNKKPKQQPFPKETWGDVISPRARVLLDQFAIAFIEVVSRDAMDRFTAVMSGAAVPAKNGARKPPPAKKSKGQKRSPEELELAVSRLLQHVKSHPGQSIEEIGKTLRMKTSELTLPMRKLLNFKDVKTKGVKRSMKYFPA